MALDEHEMYDIPMASLCVGSRILDKRREEDDDDYKMSTQG